MSQTRQLPYRIGARWGHFVLFVPVIVILSWALLGGAFVNLRATHHPVIAWGDAVFLVWGVAVFLSILFERVTFSNDAIEYRFFFIRRRYSYDQIQSIQRTSRFNLVARFVFLDGTSFKLDITTVDVAFLREILGQRSPKANAALTAILENPRLGRRTGI